MPVYQWYQTETDDNGVALADSVLVDVWFDTVAPADPSLYDVVIIDSDGDGAISASEWQTATGNAGTKARAGSDPNNVLLYDPNPGGSGFIYTNEPITAGSSGLLDSMVSTWTPIPPEDLDPTIVCFLQGTRIATASGVRRVEALKPGDMIWTRDRGLQKLRQTWTGSFLGVGIYAPVRFEAGVIGNSDVLYLSQNHRILVSGPALSVGFGLHEALVMAKSLVGAQGVTLQDRSKATYHHLIFDAHELVYSEGIASESYFTANYLNRQRNSRPLDLVAEETTGALCRPALSHKQGQLLRRYGQWSGVKMGYARHRRRTVDRDVFAI